MLFLLPIAVPEDDARAHLITTELLDRMGLRTGGTKGFAIDGQMRVLALALQRVYTARFVSTPALRFPSRHAKADRIASSKEDS